MGGITPEICALRDDPAVALATPGSGATKAAKCRTLTAHDLLSPGEVPAPTEAYLRSMLPDSGGGDDTSRLQALETAQQTNVAGGARDYSGTG